MILRSIVNGIYLILTVLFLFSCSGGDGDTKKNPTLVEIKINSSAIEIMVEETAKFTATGIYSDLSENDITDTAAWKSLDSIIVEIDSKGSALGKQAGKITISATLNNIVSNTIELTVNAVDGQKVTWITDSPWAAFQDGPGGPWVKLRSTSNIYIFTVTDPNGKFGIASYNTDFGINLVEIRYSTVSNTGVLIDDGIVGKNSLNLNVAGTSAGQFGTATIRTFDDSEYFWQNPGQLDITISGLETGLYDVFATIQQSPTPGNSTVSRYYTERNITIDQDLFKAIDFLGVNSFDAAPNNTITVNGADETVQNMSVSIEYGSTNGSNINILDQSLNSITTTFDGTPITLTWNGLPADKAIANEGYRFDVMTDSTIGDTEGIRTVIHFSSVLENKIVVLPKAIDPGSLNTSLVTTGSYVRMKTDWTVPTDLVYGTPKVYVTSILQDVVEWIVVIDSDWFDSSTSLSYTTPDFSALPGWNASFAPFQGTPLTWEFASWHGNGNLSNFINQFERNAFIEGLTFNVIGVSGTLTP